ncbi:MAG: fluoride efflux transporter CrcB [Actinomycetes bacterium]
MYDDGNRVSDAHEALPTQETPVDPDVEVGSDRAALQQSLRRQVRDLLVSRWDVLLVIAAGGALGSLLRWALGQALVATHGDFPWATFIENLSGGFALGLLMVFVLEVWPPSRYLRPFLGVGVLGGYTTFSTYMLDTRGLIAADQSPLAAIYLFGTLAAGLAAVWAGIFLARLLAEPGHRRRRRRRNPADEDLGTRRQP